MITVEVDGAGRAAFAAAAAASAAGAGRVTGAAAWEELALVGVDPTTGAALAVARAAPPLVPPAVSNPRAAVATMEVVRVAGVVAPANAGLPDKRSALSRPLTAGLLLLMQVLCFFTGGWQFRWIPSPSPPLTTPPSSPPAVMTELSTCTGLT